MRRKMGYHGVTAAAKRKPRSSALAGPVVLMPWSSDAWSAAVQKYVGPVAAEITDDARATAEGALPPTMTWGADSSAATMAAAIVSAAVGAGVALGTRVNDGVSSAVDGSTAVDAVDAVFDTAPDILDNVVGSMAEAASNLATRDVTSYVASYFGNVYAGATCTWNTMEDDRVRPAHEDADGQEVGLNEPFEVGGETLLCPGDPNGSDENTIGCRCWVETDGLTPDDLEGADDGSSDEASAEEDVPDRESVDA